VPALFASAFNVTRSRKLRPLRAEANACLFFGFCFGHVLHSASLGNSFQRWVNRELFFLCIITSARFHTVFLCRCGMHGGLTSTPKVGVYDLCVVAPSTCLGSGYGPLYSRPGDALGRVCERLENLWRPGARP